MKQFKSFLGIAIPIILCSLTISGKAQERNPALLASMDSIGISLLTCGPGQEVYSLYGHTAIRIQNTVQGSDFAVNYGTFSFDQPHFIPRFVLGLTDYEVSLVPMPLFLGEYKAENRWVHQQTLALSREEKLSILQALAENLRPENRTYRYNYFYNNCTTKARDLILASLHMPSHQDGEKAQWATTFREQIHRYTKATPWMQFGIDLLLGFQADKAITSTEAEFLPENLEKHMRTTMLKTGNGQEVPFVARQTTILQPTTPSPQAPPSPITPTLAFAILFALALAVTLLKPLQGLGWCLDMALLLASGIAGLLLLVMVFSQHPTVRLNLQIFLLNPLSLAFAYPVVRNGRLGRGHFYWYLLAGCIAMFLIGNAIQCYAEGMNILALSLLLRAIWYIWQGRKRRKNASAAHQRA